MTQPLNIDSRTVEGFGQEWSAFDQSGIPEAEHRALFDSYFSVFPFAKLPAKPEGFDLGCGSGRWALLMAERAGLLHCIDPSAAALDVARRRAGKLANLRFHLADASSIPLTDASQDFGYSLGVLHHIPDTEAAMRDCVRKLKPGAPFLVYLYYDFENRPGWFRALWKLSEAGRSIIHRLPFPVRKTVTSLIAAVVYYPLARSALLLEALGFDVQSFPLSAYRRKSFYTMRTDALDRFGTRLEQRFSRAQIDAMMSRCGITDIVFREDVPYWVACGRRAA